MAKRNVHRYDGVNLIGERNGRLQVIRKADHGKTWWVCKCDCGNTVELVACRFFQYKSCGCLEKENRKNLSLHTKTHGMTETRLYGIWCGIKDRCFNPNIEHYDRYGGRGIKVCDEWRHSFESFRNWAISAGYDETKTGKEQSIDRIDVNGDYCPENCVWIEKYFNSCDNAPFRKILNAIYDCPCFEEKYIKALIAKIPDKDQRKWLSHELKLKKHP